VKKPSDYPEKVHKFDGIEVKCRGPQWLQCVACSKWVKLLFFSTLCAACYEESLVKR
jgi:hypothetical protein